MKMFLKLYVYGDHIHYTLGDIRGHEIPSELYTSMVDLAKFDVSWFDDYIQTANRYVDEIIYKHHEKRSMKLAEDLHFWFNAVVGFVDAKLTLNV